MKDQIYKFVLEGETPLLMHHDNLEEADRLEAERNRLKGKNASKAGDDRSPPWSWMTCLYHDGKHLTIPTDVVQACLRNAGAKVTLQKQKTFKELTQSGMEVSGLSVGGKMDFEHCKFTCSKKDVALADIEAIRDLTFAQQAEAVKKLGFRLFAKRARVGNSKHVRVRPCFDAWTVEGLVHVRVAEITEEKLQAIFAAANRVGIGDWRPASKTPGRYGRFSAKLKAA